MDTLDAEILSVLQAPGTNYQASEAKVTSLFQSNCTTILIQVQGVSA